MSVKADTTGLEYQSAEWFEACAAIKRGQMAGKTVQYIAKEKAGDTWSECLNPNWREFLDYRLAPEPREVWAKFDSDGVLYHAQSHYRIGYVKFREVIE